ncbi:hypothetical protein AB4Z32_25630 [Massilia sp. 2TAF26]|uniref:hypothetical protein n=1 Tax=Massilia sp. 2TAF26 TaxID=3233012 RepID=UPI003F996A31
MEEWLKAGRKAAEDIANGEKVIRAWEVVLKFIWEHQYAGACHDTSAVLYMLLTELGLSPSLNIGEVRSQVGIFDHSWVEVDGLIFDAAVCLPHPNGRQVGGPVFASIDLTTNRRTQLIYGVESGEGFGQDALVPASTSLREYAAIQPPLNIWLLVVAFAGRIGMDLTFAGVEDKFGSVRRTVRKAG